MEAAPLRGIRVLDLTRILAGPYCSMILGDLGAEVLKIEKPGVGDDTRNWGPPWKNSQSVYFLSINRNKKSVAININSKEGVSVIKKLASSSDVLIENYLPRKLASKGLGYEQLAPTHPHLIYCSITGYGQTGPNSGLAGYDVIAAATGGLMHITGPRGGEPCRVGVAMTDLSTGLYAVSAIMASLFHRSRTGRGQHIDCDLLSTQVATLTHIGANYLNVQQEAERWGTGHGSLVPYQAFQTKDGYFIIGAGNNQLFSTLCQKMDLPDLPSDERFCDNEVRVANRDALVELLTQRFKEKTVLEWSEILRGSGVPYGPINSMEQVFSDPQVVHNNMIQEMDHPAIGNIAVPGPAVRYSDSSVVLQCPPPLLGQHTDEVLSNLLNYTPQDLERLRKQGVIA